MVKIDDCLFGFSYRCIHNYRHQLRIYASESGYCHLVVSQSSQEGINIAFHSLYGIDIMVYSLPGMSCQQAEMSGIDVIVRAWRCSCKKSGSVFDTTLIIPSEKGAPRQCPSCLLTSRTVELCLEEILQSLIVAMQLHERQTDVESKTDIVRLVLGKTAVTVQSLVPIAEHTVTPCETPESPPA